MVAQARYIEYIDLGHKLLCDAYLGAHARSNDHECSYDDGDSDGEDVADNDADDNVS